MVNAIVMVIKVGFPKPIHIRKNAKSVQTKALKQEKMVHGFFRVIETYVDVPKANLTIGRAINVWNRVNDASNPVAITPNPPHLGRVHYPLTLTLLHYFRGNLTAAWAAARRAIGTRNGLHETELNPHLWKNSIDSGSPPCSPHTPRWILSPLVARAFCTASFISNPTPNWSTDANG